MIGFKQIEFFYHTGKRMPFLASAESMKIVDLPLYRQNLDLLRAKRLSTETALMMETWCQSFLRWAQKPSLIALR